MLNVNKIVLLRLIFLDGYWRNRLFYLFKVGRFISNLPWVISKISFGLFSF